MTLGDVMDAARRHRKTLVVHAAGSDAAGSDIADHFDTRNVDVVVENDAAAVPEPAVEIRDSGQFCAVVSLSDLRSFLDPPVEDPAEYPDVYDALHELLDDTVFESVSHRQLLATTHEIEDRAYRTGNGEFHAGFQSRAAFESQRDPYELLATDTDLDVHVYLVPDANGFEDVSATVHETPHPDVGRYWFVVFDGGQTGQQCALVAEQRDSDDHHCVWTYDSDLVETALAAIHELTRFPPA